MTKLYKLTIAAALITAGMTGVIQAGVPCARMPCVGWTCASWRAASWRATSRHCEVIPNVCNANQEVSCNAWQHCPDAEAKSLPMRKEDQRKRPPLEDEARDRVCEHHWKGERRGGGYGFGGRSEHDAIPRREYSPDRKPSRRYREYHAPVAPSYDHPRDHHRWDSGPDYSHRRRVQPSPAYELRRPEIVSGSRLTILANFLQQEEGVVLCQIARTTLSCRIVRWCDRSVTFYVPDYGLRTPMDAKICIVLPNGRVAKSVSVVLVPQPSIVQHAETLGQPGYGDATIGPAVFVH